jgi:hypothetical protein
LVGLNAVFGRESLLLPFWLLLFDLDLEEESEDNPLSTKKSTFK